MKKITMVECEVLKNGYHRYTAFYEDGTSEVTRKKATRRYLNMYRYICTKNGHISYTFGKNPDRLFNASNYIVVETYPVVDRIKK